MAAGAGPDRAGSPADRPSRPGVALAASAAGGVVQGHSVGDQVPRRRDRIGRDSCRPQTGGSAVRRRHGSYDACSVLAPGRRRLRGRDPAACSPTIPEDAHGRTLRPAPRRMARASMAFRQPQSLRSGYETLAGNNAPPGFRRPVVQCVVVPRYMFYARFSWEVNKQLQEISSPRRKCASNFQSHNDLRT